MKIIHPRPAQRKQPQNVSCNPKEQTTVQKLSNRQTTKKPTRKMAHLVFPDTRANAQKPKEPFFCQLSDTVPTEKLILTD